MPYIAPPRPKRHQNGFRSMPIGTETALRVSYFSPFRGNKRPHGIMPRPLPKSPFSGPS